MLFIKRIPQCSACTAEFNGDKFTCTLLWFVENRSNKTESTTYIKGMYSDHCWIVTKRLLPPAYAVEVMFS